MAALNEAALRATIHGSRVTVRLPIDRRISGALYGDISAELIDVSGIEPTSLGGNRRSIVQEVDHESHEIEVDGLPENLERPASAKFVISWRAELNGRILRGRRSLYAALGKIEIELRGASEIPEGSSAPFRVIARDPTTMTPRPGATVQLILKASEDSPARALFTGQTDARGELATELSLPAGVEAGTLRVEVKDAEGDAWAEAAVRSVRDTRIALSSDKTIYKPGQDIELRTLVLEGPDKRPVSGEVLFEALDGKGNKVFKRSAALDEFGVAAMRVPTDARVFEGLWTFRASVAGSKTELKLPVERYNLPKLRVLLTTEREFALAGDSVRGKVDARYVFGSPVIGASVQLRLEGQDGSRLVEQTLQTDDGGRAAFEVRIPAGVAPDEGGAAVQLVAEVTDTAGQRELGALSLPVTRGALVIQTLSESVGFVPGVEQRIYLLVTDPVGRPLVAEVDVDGLGARRTIPTDASGVAELRFTPAAEAKHLDLQLLARDGAGRTFSRALGLDASGDAALVLRTNKAVYDPGEIATVEVLTTGSAQRVYLDVYRGAEGVESLAIDLSNGRGSAAITLGADSRGLLVIDALALLGSGRVSRASQRVLVKTDDRLAIAIESDQTTFAPGAGAQIRVRATDQAGAPKVASVGLSVVDEAVFALGGEPKSDLLSTFGFDPRSLPPEVRVLGRSSRDLFNSNDANVIDRLARLLFAAAKEIAAFGFEYNSIREEAPAVRAVVEDRVRRDAVLVLKDLIPWAQRQEPLTEDAARRVILSEVAGKRDPFGQLYAATLGADGNWQQLIVRSLGPDELASTPDDVSVELWYGWILWAAAADIDADGNLVGGWGRGGGFAEDAAAGAPNAAANQGAGPPPAPPPGAKTGSDATATRVRRDFRETVLYRPMLITDARGEASVTVPLADSITTWRVSAEGSTRDGKIGAARFGVRTFQDFFVDFSVPTNLTRGDVIELPAIVYNYLSEPTTVTVSLDPAPWMELLSEAQSSVTLAPSEVRAVKFTVRALRAGTQSLTLRASAGAISDALEREAIVAPDGAPEDQSFSDRLNGLREYHVTLPSDAIEGGTTLYLTLTPGFAGEAVSGTEALLQEPNGCFEQTTATAWPNTLVTHYLDTTGQLTPELRAQATDLVTRGYQRLLTFESPTGGYNWWGNGDPGNRILSAIMLWHLKDMEGIIETDPAVRERTLRWLLDQQASDGSWASGDALHAGNEVLGTSAARTTAFIAWALAHTEWAQPAVDRAIGYLAAHPADGADLYATALAANAFAVAAPAHAAARPLFDRLDAQKQDNGDGRLMWPTEAPSWTGASGDVGAIETTGLVAYGLLRGEVLPEAAIGAVRYLVAKKDAVGSWYNTQATMNALRALLAAASPRGSEAEGTLLVTVNGQPIAPVAITREDGDIYRRIDLSAYLVPGDNRVELSMSGTGELTYQLSRRVHRPRAATTAEAPLDLTVSYGSTSPSVGLPVQLSVSALYRGAGTRDQVMVRVGRAPGFEPRVEQLEAMVGDGRIARYEINARDVTLYLMGLQSGAARDLSFAAIPTLVFQGEAPASSIYAYYEPAVRAEVAPVALNVRP
ncbi:MAG: hypothetical protein IT384_29590 [Deltaproteobacteria bacterium]|nr:hypothetical protein [Deltaproteobacteria bacterium]